MQTLAGQRGGKAAARRVGKTPIRHPQLPLHSTPGPAASRQIREQQAAELAENCAEGSPRRVHWEAEKDARAGAPLSTSCHAGVPCGRLLACGPPSECLFSGCCLSKHRERERVVIMIAMTSCAYMTGLCVRAPLRYGEPIIGRFGSGSPIGDIRAGHAPCAPLPPTSHSHLGDVKQGTLQKSTDTES